MSQQPWMMKPQNGSMQKQSGGPIKALPVPPRLNPENDRVCPTCGSDFLVLKVQAQCEPSHVIGELQVLLAQNLTCLDCRNEVGDLSKAPLREKPIEQEGTEQNG